MSAGPIRDRLRAKLGRRDAVTTELTTLEAAPILDELHAQETALKAQERRISELPDDAPSLSTKALAGRVAAVAAKFRATLKEGEPKARRLLQRVLNGRRVPCDPFRELGRRGYRFSEKDIPYSGVLSSDVNDVGGPNGK